MITFHFTSYIADHYKIKGYEPNTLGPNDLLKDDNYFLWEFNARMALARKGLDDHVMAAKPEHAMLRETAEWKAADPKALAIVARMLSPNYQSMIREVKTALEAWEILRNFFVKQNLHNRVQLRKQLHDFHLEDGGNLMDHLLHFDDLCLRLSAVGDKIDNDERLVILLGSLPREYDAMIKIIESQSDTTLLDAKEMLRREYESLQKRDKEEGAFRAAGYGTRHSRCDKMSGSRQGFRKNASGGQRGAWRQRRVEQPHGQQRKREQQGFPGRCYECGQVGHKRDQCPQLRREDDNNEYVFTATSGRTARWLLDSGASSHMTCDRGDFYDFRPLKEPLTISVASGHRLEASGVGSVKFILHSGKEMQLTEVLYVAGLDRKLVSIPALASKGVEIRFRQDGCSIYFRGEELNYVKKWGKMYEWGAELKTLPRDDSDLVEVAAASTPVTDVAVWHARLGHPSAERMEAVSGAVDGVPDLHRRGGGGDMLVCEGCAKGKMHVSSYAHTSGSKVKTSQPLELVHSDVMGPMTPKSRGGSRFVVTFIDDFSRLVHVYLLKSKSEVLARFQEYKALVENQTGLRLRCLRTDNGGEYTGKAFNAYCAKHGIARQTTVPYSPQQNGLAERMNRTLVEMARSMIYHQHLETSWWGEALYTAAYLTNRLPNSARHNTTPFHLFYRAKPRCDHLHVFGARGYVFVDKSKRGKWDSKAHRCIFLGYAAGTKGYRVWDEEANKLVITRTITLNEQPPDAHVTWLPEANDEHQPIIFVDDNEPISHAPEDDDPRGEPMEVDPDPTFGAMEIDDAGTASDMVPDSISSNPIGQQQAIRSLQEEEQRNGFMLPEGEHRSNIAVPQHSTHTSNTLERPVTAMNGASPPALLTSTNSRLLRSRSAAERGIVPSAGSDQLVFHGGNHLSALPTRDENRFLRDVNSTALPSIPRAGIEADTGSGESQHFLLENGEADAPASGSRALVEYNGTSDDESGDEPESKRPRLDDGYEIALAVTELPQTYEDAITSAHAAEWKAAIRSELASHIRNHTWDIIRRPPGVKVIGHKWVFAVKTDEHGNITRYKARLVALGFLQTPGVDYIFTYAPVASQNTLRVFFAVCCHLGYCIKQFDFETAFLNGKLTETVYMTLPKGVRAPAGSVCVLRRSIYGLKQAAAVWFSTIRDTLVSIGFRQCKSDGCLFTRNGKHGLILLVLYVDDLMIGCKEAADAEEVARELEGKFKLKSLGDVHYILGMEIHYDKIKGELHLCQSQCISRMLERFGQLSAFGVRNPCVLGQDLRPTAENARLPSNKQYRELIGSLLYVANGSRPDICVPVSLLSQYLEEPTQMHWRAALRVLHYLKATVNLGIKYVQGAATEHFVVAYSDANWGGDLATRRSTSGILLKIAGGPVIFRSKKQSTVALSTAEAEYVALSATCQEVLWLRQLLREIGFNTVSPTTICVDNKSAICMATNTGYSPRAKHIDLKYHFIREHIARSEVKLLHVPSALQLADFLTKQLPTPQLTKLIELCGMTAS